MATVNRFDQPVNIRSTYMPKEFIPNLDAYAQVMGQQQAQYDQLLDTANKVPRYLTADEQRVEQYRQSMQENIDRITDSYVRNGLQSGNVARRDYLRQLQNDWQPGGEAYVIDQNYQAFQTYKEQLDDQLAKGNISNRKYNTLLKTSVDKFQGSFVNDQENKFSGIQAAKDVDLAQLADERAKGWMADRVQSGRYRIMGGQYFDMQEKKFVDPKEVYKGVLRAISSSPEAIAYLQQEKELFGADIKKNLHAAAAYAAQKYGYTEYDSQYLSNWVMKQNRQFAHDERMKKSEVQDYLTSTVINNPLFKGKELDPTTWNKQGQLYEDTSESPRGYSRISKRSATRQGTEGQTLQEYANTPPGREDYPALDRFYREYPIQRDDNGVPTETREEYDQRVAEIYNNSMDELQQSFINYRTLGKEKQKRLNSILVEGGGYALTNLVMIDDNNNVTPITDKKLQELTNTTDETFSDFAQVVAEAEPNNAAVTGGTVIMVKVNEGPGHVQVIATPESTPQTEYKAGIREAWSVKYDPIKDESAPFYADALIPGTDQVGTFQYKSFGQWKKDEETGQMLRKVYATEVDDDGNPIKGRDAETGEPIYYEPDEQIQQLNLNQITTRHMEVYPFNN